MRIVVVELNKYHSETFPIYENLLPSFFNKGDLEWFYYQLPAPRNRRSTAYPYVRPIIGEWEYFLIRNLGFRIPVFARKVQHIVDSTGADVVVFNSIEPKRNQRVFEAVTASKKIALIHNAAAFSPHEKRGNEFFFVLSPIVYHHFRNTLPLDGYLLPFFKPYTIASHQRNGDKTIIGIQGLVNFVRRDYAFLIQVAGKLKEEGIETVLFNIIGSNNKKGGKKLRELIRVAGLESFFKLHEYLDDQAFFAEIEQCDVLMPLLGPEHEVYFKDKTTATFSHAVAYNKPMVLWRRNAEAWNLDGRTQYVYDDVDDCADILQHLTALPKKKERFEQWRNIQIDINRELLLSRRPLTSK